LNREYEEDEIDLRELFLKIWNNKWKIVLFTGFITSIVLFKLIKTPNIYNSEIRLIPQEQKSSMGGFGALAGLAGVDMGMDSVSAYTSMASILNDRTFNEMVVEKYGLLEKLENRKNLVYPFGLEFETVRKEKNVSKEEKMFNAYLELTKIVTISEDKKSGLIVISAQIEDRFFAKELVDIYLLEITSRLRTLDQLDTDSKISFYEKELLETTSVELQSKITQLLSTLIQKRVLASASQYYLVKKITDSKVAFIGDKVKPKRGLILVITFITSIIIAIFGVFFIDFIRGGKEHSGEK
jgi:uncharacterized protein involved in exopolysaccharide biosynthesis